MLRRYGGTVPEGLGLPIRGGAKLLVQYPCESSTEALHYEYHLASYSYKQLSGTSLEREVFRYFYEFFFP